MKIRNGFVSNSSSSSFMIFGKEISYDTYKEYLQENNIEFDEDADFWDVLETNLQYPYYDDAEGERFFVGKEIIEMQLDETKRQFQDRVEQELVNRFGKMAQDPQWILETIYD